MPNASPRIQLQSFSLKHHPPWATELSREPHTHDLNSFSQHSGKRETMILTPTLEMGKLKHREVKNLVQGFRAEEQILFFLLANKIYV